MSDGVATLNPTAPWIAHHLRNLWALMDMPLDNVVPTRTWRASYRIGSELVSLLLTHSMTAQTNGSPITAQITRGFTAAPQHVTFLKLPPNYSLDDLIAFCRLDLVDPASVEWRETTTYRDSTTVERALTDAIAQHATAP